MNHRKRFEIEHPRPVCVGTGLVALDVVINGSPESPPRLWAGGSCGNVLAILSYLRWESYPIARLGNDEAATKLLNDLEGCKVRTSLITQSVSGSTPIIIEKLSMTRNGTPRHHFEWICPNCGTWLPKYKPVLAKSVEKIINEMPKCQVFYFDRVTRSSIELAKANKTQGALIVFEPSGIKDKKLFSECLQIADIIKYSHERLGKTQELTQDISVPLEIETFGAEGLRYRLGCKDKRKIKWKTMLAYPVKKLKDAAGSGDWCSAGIIHLLGYDGRKSFEESNEKDIHSALSFGQALAALNCYYEGARGSMYNISRQKFEELIKDIWNGESPLETADENEAEGTLKVFKCICPNCIKKDSIK